MQQCSCPHSHQQPQPCSKKVEHHQPVQHQVIDGARVSQLAKSIQLRDDPIDWNLVKYFLLGTLLYYAACGPFAYFFSLDLFPHTDTESSQFRELYYRYWVNTTYVSFGTFLFFIGMYIIGFTFVEVVNLQNYRKDPFMSRDGSYKDIKTQVIMAVAMFALAGMVTLRQKNDLSEYCKPHAPINETLAGEFFLPQTVMESGFPKMNMTAAMLSDKPLHQIFASIDRMDYLTKHLTQPECHSYSSWEIFKYNYLIWVAAYFVGLQFTHLDNGIFQQLTLDWNVMKDWPLILWIIFFGLVILIATIVVYILFLYSSIGYLEVYITGISTFVGVFIFLYKWYSMLGYNLHVHHWFLGAALQGVMCYQNGWITALHAIFAGIMTEGASRWGYDPLFEAPHFLSEKSALAMTKMAQSVTRKHNAVIAELQSSALMSMHNVSAAPLISQPPMPAAPVYHYHDYQFVEHPEKDMEVAAPPQPTIYYPNQHQVLVQPADANPHGTISKAASMMA